MIANYHTHTRWCRHATGEIEDYIQEAVRKGLRAVAITEHVPHSQNFDPRRMQWEEFPAYNAELDRLIEKYQDQIHVIKGFECEYYPFSLENYKMFRDQYGYKLLILGHHTNSDRTADNFAPKGEAEMKRYADEVIEGLRTGLFTFLAHPDVPFCGYTGSADFALEQMGRIFAVCEELGIPVEINANGYRDGRAYPDRSSIRIPMRWRISAMRRVWAVPKPLPGNWAFRSPSGSTGKPLLSQEKHGISSGSVLFYFPGKAGGLIRKSYLQARINSVLSI